MCNANQISWSLENKDLIDWMAGLASNSIDALFADPPYSSGGLFRSDRVVGSANRKYLNDASQHPDFFGENKDQWSYFLWSCHWLREAFRVMRNGAAFAIFIDWRQLTVLHSAVQAAGFVLRGIAVWNKTRGCRPQKGKFRQQGEFVLWGSKGEWDAQTEEALDGVFTYAPMHGGKKLHTAGKPVQLMKDLIAVTAPNALIMDPFAGSATTGVAALEMGRRFTGCEQSPDYFEIASTRLKEVAGQG